MLNMMMMGYILFIKQKTTYEIQDRDWSSDVCCAEMEVEMKGENDEERLGNTRQNTEMEGDNDEKKP